MGTTTAKKRKLLEGWFVGQHKEGWGLSKDGEATPGGRKFPLSRGAEHRQEEPQWGCHREESSILQEVWRRPSITHALSVRFSRCPRMRERVGERLIYIVFRAYVDHKLNVHIFLFSSLAFCHTDKESNIYYVLKACHWLCGPKCSVTRNISEGYVSKTTNKQSSG